MRCLAAWALVQLVHLAVSQALSVRLACLQKVLVVPACLVLQALEWEVCLAPALRHHTVRLLWRTRPEKAEVQGQPMPCEDPTGETKAEPANRRVDGCLLASKALDGLNNHCAARSGDAMLPF